MIRRTPQSRMIVWADKLSLILGHGVDLGIVKSNPALKATAHVIRTAATVPLYTPQRTTDVVEMEWSAVSEQPDGSILISLSQAKTGELITVRRHRALVAILLETPEE